MFFGKLKIKQLVTQFDKWQNSYASIETISINKNAFSWKRFFLYTYIKLTLAFSFFCLSIVDVISSANIN